MAHLNWGTGLDGATVDVQIGFGFAPATAIASITWTSIITWLRSLSYTLGKSDELNGYQPGRLTMTLDNRDRRFDPLHATGPYFGNLKPMVPIRVRETYSGTTVTKWTGFVSGFPQSYSPPRDATVTVTASDGFSVLARTILPSTYAYEVGLDSPSLWWRFGESAGTVAVDSSGNHNDGTYEGGATFNSRDGLILDADNAITFTAPESAARYGFAWPAFPFSIEFWFATTAPAAGINFPFVTFGGAAQANVNMLTGTVTAQVNNATSNASRSSTAATYNDGFIHHLVATWTNGSTAPVLYLDGVSDTTGASGVVSTVPALGTVEVHLPSPFTPLFVGTIDEFAVYPTALSAGRVATHYSAGTTPFSNANTGTAITYILDVIGWPSADRTIETGKSALVSFDMGGMTALEAIQAIEKTEQGRFFIAPDGKATFYSRHHTLTTAASNTSQATFGDSGAELPYGDLNLEFDETKIRNSVMTARANGSPFNVKDAASITSYRERGYSLTGLLNASDGDLRDIALWILGHYAQPVTRVPQIVIQPRRSPTTLFPHIRDRKLCDRITVKRRPQNVGSAISIDVLIEGVQHDLTADGAWQTTLMLSPAETTGFFILDDTVFGRLDNNALAF